VLDHCERVFACAEKLARVTTDEERSVALSELGEPPFARKHGDHPTRWWLREIALERFKAAFDSTVPLKMFNVIIGPNGSGKSTLIDALQWLDAAIRYGVVEACGLINQQGDAREWFRLGLEWESYEDFDFYDNEDDGEPANRIVHHLDYRLDTRRIPEVGPAGPVAVFWRDAVFLRPGYALGSPLATRGDSDPILDDEARLLPVLLAENYVNNCLAKGDNLLEIALVPGNYGVRERLVAGGETVFVPSRMMSSGMRRLIAILTLLVREPAPSLLCIEEIENGFDPWTVRYIIACMRSLANRGTQILITTQSCMRAAVIRARSTSDSSTARKSARTRDRFRRARATCRRDRRPAPSCCGSLPKHDHQQSNANDEKTDWNHRSHDRPPNHHQHHHPRRRLQGDLPERGHDDRMARRRRNGSRPDRAVEPLPRNRAKPRRSFQYNQRARRCRRRRSRLPRVDGG